MIFSNVIYNKTIGNFLFEKWKESENESDDENTPCHSMQVQTKHLKNLELN